MKSTLIKWRKHKDKGFTLVELLVVLVILAILAAAVIPSMMGFIDRAKKESIAAEQRSVLLAAQVELNELYGKNDMVLQTDFVVFDDKGGIGSNPQLKAMNEIADLPGRIASVTVTKNTDGAGNGKDDGHWIITEAKYTAKDGKGYTYTYDTVSQSGAWTEDG